MTVEQMEEVVSAVLADEDQELIADDLEITPGRINYLEDRTITCPEAPFRCQFRVWGTGNRVVLVFFLAEDADPGITEPLEALCRECSVQFVWVPTMVGLGSACGIEVGAAAAAAVD